jgi:hypothetical protein
MNMRAQASVSLRALAAALALAGGQAPFLLLPKDNP